MACTVFFEDPFWVGVFERTDEDGRFCAAKLTFGAEPSLGEIWAAVRGRFDSLAFSAPVWNETREQARVNPKRMQREAARALSAVGVGTRAQQALKAQYEANKTEHREISRQEREAGAQRKFELRQEKKKEKRKGH